MVICVNNSVRVALGDGWLWVGKGWLGVSDEFELGIAVIVEKGLLWVGDRSERGLALNKV